jgi:hypothetical protein
MYFFKGKITKVGNDNKETGAQYYPKLSQTK